MTMAKAAPSAPVISHLRPLMTKSSPSFTAVVFSSDGSAPAPGDGSVMQKQERTRPEASGFSQRAFCSSLQISCSMCMLPSSGAAMCRATGPSIE
ncbi:hypothetical protein D9M72_536860 [compost metagenome]